MQISVVIPTFNRQQFLERTLPELANQRVVDCRYEVVFVINGSTDGSEAVLREASLKWPGKIRYFRIDPSGTPAAPRNRGIREAKGAAIIFLDDDVVPDRDLVQHYAEFHRAHPEPHQAALGELLAPEELAEDPSSVFLDLFRYDRFRGHDRLGFQDFWTCNVSLKRAFMLDYGMFDESMSYFEDVDCGYRLVSGGMHLHFVPQARGRHFHRWDLKTLPAKARHIGRGLYEFETRVPASEARQVRARHGVFSWDLPPRLLLRRLVNRVGFAAVGNPVCTAILRALASRSPKRNRFSDLYHIVTLRSNMRAGYRAARRLGLTNGRAGESPHVWPKDARHQATQQ